MVESPFWRDERGREGRESMGGPTRWPGKAERPFRKGQEELGGPPEGLGWVDRPYKWARRGQEAHHRARKFREAIFEVQESLGGPAGGTGGHSPRGTGGVGRPLRMDGRDGKILWEGPEGSGEMGGVGMPFRRPEVVWKPSQKTRRSWKSILESQEGLGVPSGKPGKLGEVRRTYQKGR